MILSEIKYFLHKNRFLILGLSFFIFFFLPFLLYYALPIILPYIYPFIFLNESLFLTEYYKLLVSSLTILLSAIIGFAFIESMIELRLENQVAKELHNFFDLLKDLEVTITEMSLHNDNSDFSKHLSNKYKILVLLFNNFLTSDAIRSKFAVDQYTVIHEFIFIFDKVFTNISSQPFSILNIENLKTKLLTFRSKLNEINRCSTQKRTLENNNQKR